MNDKLLPSEKHAHSGHPLRPVQALSPVRSDDLFDVLVAIVKKRLQLEQSLYTILQILSITLFEKTLISWVFTESYYKDQITSNHIQLKLFNS